MTYSRSVFFDVEPNDLDLTRFIGGIDERLRREANIEITQSSDFRKLEQLCAAEKSRDDLSVCFRSTHFDLGPGNAFWIGGWDKRGHLVHTQALRLENLGGRSLGEHLSQQMRRLYVDGKDPGVSFNGFCGVANHIGGLVGYHGELWVHPDRRGQGLAAMLSRLGLATALARWRPDWIYGFVNRALVAKGVSIREGYMHHEPVAIDWSNPPGGFDSEEWLVYASKLDLCNLARQPDSELCPEPEDSQFED